LELVKEKAWFVTDKFKHEMTIISWQHPVTALCGILFGIAHHLLGFPVELSPSIKWLPGKSGTKCNPDGSSAVALET
jgi:hypothetical protein